MVPLFDLMLRHVSPPTVEDGPFRMLGTILESNPVSRARRHRPHHVGSVKPNQAVKVLDRDGDLIEDRPRHQGARLPRARAHRRSTRRSRRHRRHRRACRRRPSPHTICAPEVTVPLPAQPIDPPTLAMTFRINDSPLAGTEGDKVQSRVIRERLLREAEGNVALRIGESTREGFHGGRRPRRAAARRADRDHAARGIRAVGIAAEGSVQNETPIGELLEPIEEVVIDVDEEHSGIVVQKLAERKAEMVEMRPSGGGRVRLVFYGPTRGLIGYQGELLTDTRGTAVMNRLFHGYGPYRGEIVGRRNGVLISSDSGDAVAYALWNLEDRGPMMIEPGWKVYPGMIVGEHTRGNDLDVNVLKGKKLTNIRTHSKDEAVRLTPPIQMTLERALAYISDDELVEVTPKAIRLRKKLLDPNDRKKEDRRKEAERV